MKAFQLIYSSTNSVKYDCYEVEVILEMTIIVRETFTLSSSNPTESGSSASHPNHVQNDLSRIENQQSVWLISNKLLNLIFSVRNENIHRYIHDSVTIELRTVLEAMLKVLVNITWSRKSTTLWKVIRWHRLRITEWLQQVRQQKFNTKLSLKRQFFSNLRE